ncbi:MAG: tetraacyldisaccharide 4'-kinase [Chlamydiia bacterium]|nr:tetraacyldisaccharide 4'-kinase [Chlamydiia bacterium]
MINWILWSGAAIKNWFIDRGWVASMRSQLPVISVGNLAPGGSGKTAFVQWLVERLDKPAVLTRGYKSQLEHRRPTLIDSKTDPKVCGDEPAMLAQLPCRPMVIVGKNRRAGAQLAKDVGARILILDDGMQYRYLKRDIEIVMLSKDDLDGKILREPPTALKRADLIVIMDAYDKNECNVLLQKLAHITHAPVAGAHYVLPNLQGQDVAAFCALGRPDRFFQDLKRAGANVVATRFKRDHKAFTEAELKAFAKAAGTQLVCTRKDGVKLGQIDIPITVIDAGLNFAFGYEHIEEVLREIMDQNFNRSGSRSNCWDCTSPI